MITALVSGLFGAFNALLPDVMGYFKKKQEMEERQRDRVHELNMLDKTADVQIRIGAQKIEETRVGGEMAAMAAEIRGSFEQMKSIYAQQAPIGNVFADVWNAVLRPAAVSIILFVFATGVLIYEVSVVVLWWKGMLPAGDIIEAMFRGLVGEAIQAVLGYLFGYRGTNSARSYAASRA